MGVPVYYMGTVIAKDLARYGIKKMAYLANTYSADSVNVLKPSATVIRLIAAGWPGLAAVDYVHSSVDRYDSSIQQGIYFAEYDVRTVLAQCPHAQIIMAGYSQGAIAVHDAENYLAKHKPGEFSHIAGTLLLGDGDRTPNSKAHRFGSESKAGEGVRVYLCLVKFLHICLVKPHDVPAPATTAEIANRGDIVADFTLGDLRHFKAAARVHESYARQVNGKLTAEKVLEHAANWVAAASGVLGPHYTGGTVQITGTAGTAVSGTATVVGGVGALTAFTGTGGTVPSWLSLAMSGHTVTLSGTPTAPGTWAFDIEVQDSQNHQAIIPVTITVSSGGGTWGSAQEVARNLNGGGQATVNSVSCASAGNCAAGGDYIDSSGKWQAFVVSEVNGTWGKAVEVAGSLNVGGQAGVGSVSCASAGNCAAGGSYSDSAGPGQSQAFVVSEVNGTWGRAVEVAGNLNGTYSNVSAVSCASAGNCAAGGDYGEQAFVVSEVNGVWGSAQEVAGNLSFAQVDSVSCSSVGNCAVGGWYSPQGAYQAFVADEVNGTWGNAIEVPGIAALNAFGYAGINSVSCASAGNCAAGGIYTDSRRNEQAFVVSEVNGVWGNAIEVAGNLNVGGQAVVNSVSCASAADCAVGGYYTDSSSNLQAFVVSEVNGTWGTAIEVPGFAALNAGGNGGFYPPPGVDSVSCGSAGNCAAGGWYVDSFGTAQAFVVSEVNGVWGSAQEVAENLDVNSANVDSVSCTSAGSCTAGGGPWGAFVVSKK